MRGGFRKAFSGLIIVLLLALPCLSYGQEQGNQRAKIIMLDGHNFEGVIIKQDAEIIVLLVKLKKTESKVIEIIKADIDTIFYISGSKGFKGALLGGGGAAALFGIASVLEKSPESGLPGTEPSDKTKITVPIVAGGVILGTTIGYLIARKHKKTIAIKATRPDRNKKTGLSPEKGN